MHFSVDGTGMSCIFFGRYDSLTLVVADPASTSTSAYKHEGLHLPLLALNVHGLCAPNSRGNDTEKQCRPAHDTDDGSYENDCAALSEF